MKKLIIAAILATATLTQAALTTILGDPVTVNGTFNSSQVTIAGASVPQGTLYVYNGGLASTNALIAYRQVSLDGTNFVTVATYNPTATNSTTDTWSAANTNLNIYSRVQIVTTNAVSVGVTLQN